MATLVDQEFFARLRALNEKFAAGLPETLARLRRAGAAFDPGAPEAALVAQMHQVLHTVAGSAATFGFQVLGQQARELEQRQRVLLAFEAVPAAAWRDWLAALDAYLAWAERDPKAGYSDRDCAQ